MPEKEAYDTVLSLKKSELTEMKWKLDNENADEDNDEDDKVVCKKIIRFFTGTASQNWSNSSETIFYNDLCLCFDNNS